MIYDRALVPRAQLSGGTLISIKKNGNMIKVGLLADWIGEKNDIKRTGISNN